MEQRVSFITLAVADLARTRELSTSTVSGREPIFAGDDVLMLPVAERLILSLWSIEGFTAEIGEAPASGIPPMTLAAHNLATPAEVDDVLAEAALLGAPGRAPGGGASGEGCWATSPTPTASAGRSRSIPARPGDFVLPR